MSNAQEPLKVSDEIIAICAVNATRRTDGVAAMAGGFTDMLNKSLLGREIAAKGVKVSQNDGMIELDIHIIAKYGCQIPVVAWDIQENVKDEIQFMTGLEIEAVNIHVQGVKADDEK
ncbi:MAG: Asp23/Gls24 family envelope stress response protein [Firmicutes bacterium]|nr:Asp23/Gls24 family envelope stress response protein [Bacillota bacterium]